MDNFAFVKQALPILMVQMKLNTGPVTADTNTTVTLVLNNTEGKICPSCYTTPNEKAT